MMTENTSIKLPVVRRGAAKGTCGWLARELDGMRIELTSATTTYEGIIPAVFLKSGDGQRSLYLASSTSTRQQDPGQHEYADEFFGAHLTEDAQDALDRLAKEAQAEVEKWVASGDAEAEGVKFELRRAQNA